MKLSQAVLLTVAQAELKFDLDGNKSEFFFTEIESSLTNNSDNKEAQSYILGKVSESSAQWIAAGQDGSFPPARDILYSQSQAAQLASRGIPVSQNQIASAPSSDEIKRDLEKDVDASMMFWSLWQENTNYGCNVITDPNCKWMIPYFYDDGTTDEVRTTIASAMASIEAKTCLKFEQRLSNSSGSDS